ncbi:hypothetical protein G7070_02710 [Propioniciclava coleopterorum]|uniref:DUF7824 domain-containing protein n=1 Tax=Propioniciclava coleopterorum TaxID=2714937 RepID=A0A6G7Y454_9ACTN|nr:hypothetical protein [Propioniciclava coleopterorum]QIK71397.1 hypothetical protein G7070_02710 [Propioniciclava coleopterorum]
MTALADAVAVFRELGWADADLSRALELPLGTPEQRAVARKGVAKGVWGAFGEVGPNRYAWVSAIGVDGKLFLVFALRQGVSARRAAQLLRDVRTTGLDQALAAVFEAGNPGAVARALFPGDGGQPWTVQAALRLLVPGDEEPPTGRAYLRAWTRLAERALIHNAGGKDLARWRFADHVRAAIAAGVPAAGSPEAGPIALVLGRGVELGLLERDEAVELSFGGLDASARPSDRITWLDTLAGLGVTDADLLERADALVPLLGFGDAALIERLTPILLAGDDATAVDVVLVALAAKTKKTRRAVLEAAASRPRPAGAELVADVVAGQAADTDRGVARAAAALAASWGLDAAPVAPGPAPVTGAWRPTPPLWTVPAFRVPEATPGALTDAAATLTGRASTAVPDVEVERFWALAVAVAHADAEAARAALRGVKQEWRIALGAAASWVRGEPCAFADRLAGESEWQTTDVHLGLIRARDAQLAERLGELPVLLSTPSRDDLSVLPDALTERLARYAVAGVAVAEADLVLAATRLDLPAVTDAHRAAWRDLDVPVLGSRGPIAASAGPTLAAYTLDPVLEPAPSPTGSADGHGQVVKPASLAAFPPRLGGGWSGVEQGVHPAWARAFSSGDDGIPTGTALRQLARRAAPLSDMHAADLLTAQRDLLDADPDGAAQAALEAFERGLLLPGAADAALLAEPPTALASLALAWQDTAQLGLASVVWGALDALALGSVLAQRLQPGTAEVVDALAALAPEVRAAVSAGHADAAVWDLPGLRRLAERSGSSRAVTAARAMVADLPAAVSPPPEPEPEPAIPFEQAWPEGVGSAPTVPDGARVSARWGPGPRRMLVVQIAAPVGSFRVAKRWFYDLEVEGQCQADDAATGATRWLWWDADAAVLAASPHRNRTEGNDNPLRLAGPVPPLTVAMAAVTLVGLCQEQDVYTAREVATGLGTGSVRLAMAALLADSPDVSPAKIVAALDADPALLPAFWPVLTQSVRHAATHDKPPHWLNRILDAALRHADTLAEASRRGLIPAEDAAWPGLGTLADRPGQTAALRKARELRQALGL